MSNAPIIVLGGGLAGLTAAVHLSKLGHSIIVIEKNEYPKHKVCGEYISNEVIDYFKWLGLDNVLQKSHPIHKFQLDLGAANFAEVELPLGGFGISRFEMDNLLYEKAVDQKVQFIHETAQNIQFRDNVFTIELSSGVVLQTSVVLGSFGKRSTLDVQLKRNFIQKKSHWMAVKSHYNVKFPNHLVGLYPFHGGYCGVSKVENNVVNICYIVQTNIFKKCKNIADFELNILKKNNALALVFDDAKTIFKNPLTISQISFEQKKAIEDHIIMIGDAAGLIHPLCGNGMAMAIHSAKIASELIDKSLKKTAFSRVQLEADYQKKWNQTFKKRLAMGKVLSFLLLNQTLTNFSLKIVARVPALFKCIIKKTHGTIISVPTNEY